MSQTIPLHVAAAIFIRDQKVLACRRAPHKSSPGLWEFPGGKVEPGETSFVALVREIKEELGFECKPRETYDVSITKVGELEIKLETIVCPYDSDQELSSTDHDEFRWLEIDELHKVKWAKPDRPAVKKLSMVIY
jgi:8-oxo-dGTP diphosphatase